MHRRFSDARDARDDALEEISMLGMLWAAQTHL